MKFMHISETVMTVNGHTVKEAVKPSGWTLKSGSKARENVEPEEKDVTLWKLLVVNVCRLQIVEL